MAGINELRLQRDAARLAAHLLYVAHSEVGFDTDEDTELQQKVLANARTLWPNIDKEPS